MNLRRKQGGFFFDSEKRARKCVEEATLKGSSKGEKKPPTQEGNVQEMLQALAAVNVRIGLAPMRWVDSPELSYQLMAIGGGLLIAAAMLMAWERKAQAAADGTSMRKELLPYLARIANALERMERPSAENATAQVVRRLEELAHARENGKVREMPKYRSK